MKAIREREAERERERAREIDIERVSLKYILRIDTEVNDLDGFFLRERS